MKKEEIKRDNNGRFVKKSVESKKAAKSKKDAAPKCELFVFPSEDKGKTPDEYIKQLENERDMFKYLAERNGYDYLNKCVVVSKKDAKVKEAKEIIKSLRNLIGRYEDMCNYLFENMGVFGKRKVADYFTIKMQSLHITCTDVEHALEGLDKD